MFNKLFNKNKSKIKIISVDLASKSDSNHTDYKYVVDEDIITAPKSIRWTEEELALFDKGLSNMEIMAATGRTMSAITTKRSRLKNR